MATDLNGMNSRDADQVIRSQAIELSDGTLAQSTITLASLVTEPYDAITLTYILAGNGAGEIGTVSYRQGGAAGTIVQTLTLTYDASNNLETIVRS